MKIKLRQCETALPQNPSASKSHLANDSIHCSALVGISSNSFQATTAPGGRNMGRLFKRIPASVVPSMDPVLRWGTVGALPHPHDNGAAAQALVPPRQHAGRWALAAIACCCAAWVGFDWNGGRHGSIWQAR